MTAHNNAPTGTPQGPHQPRWAWWVIGIVIPVVGILVTILVSGRDSSDGTSEDQAQSPVRSSSSKESTDGEQPAAPSEESAAAAEVLYGPDDFEVDLGSGGMRYLDLDSTAPVVTGTDGEGDDLTVSTTAAAPTLYTPKSGNTLAALPASGSAPTESQCAEAVADNGTYSGEAARGSRFCLATTEGRTAYLSVVSAPAGRGTAKFKVTVWETPAG
ncbi:hypothetical protein AB0E85_31750 [Streptomyces sp. NPDC029044]|uniref:hypothetical protein n=1 Tax=Streptomyces sp. NPDC029044 TaxID=3157198 RepID=UPI0033FC97EB